MDFYALLLLAGRPNRINTTVGSETITTGESSESDLVQNSL